MRGRVGESAGLAAFNSLPSTSAEQALLGCCSSPRWAATVAAGRPYASTEALYTAADRALAKLGERDRDAALGGHPRIGERGSGAAAASSDREQAGLAGARQGTRDALAQGNRAYEALFGHVYLVCADGRGADQLLAMLYQRLGNDPATERAVLRGELGKINRIRLRRLLESYAELHDGGGDAWQE